MNPSIRILHVVHSLDAGGMENGIINVANSLGEDFEIHIACLESRGRMASRMLYQSGIHVLNKKPGFSVRTVMQLARCIWAVRPHVLHTHNLGSLIYGSLASCCGRSPVILHGEHSQLSPDDLRPKRLRERRFFYRFPRRIHTVSRGLVDELAKHGIGGNKLLPIVNGVDTVRFRPLPGNEIRGEIGIPREVPVIGIVGRFGPYKCHDVLISAFERIRELGMPLHLLVIGGGGSEEVRVRELCESSAVADSIHLLGFSDRPEDFYPAMDLLVVPSVNEGLSNAVLEAMSCGIPVLSHVSCGSAELMQSGVEGVVADLSKPDLVAAEVQRLLADPEYLQRMGTAARKKVAERFSLDRMAQGYADLYRALWKTKSGNGQ